jgi:hypothetical protein
MKITVVDILQIRKTVKDNALYSQRLRPLPASGGLARGRVLAEPQSRQEKIVFQMPYILCVLASSREIDPLARYKKSRPCGAAYRSNIRKGN